LELAKPINYTVSFNSQKPSEPPFIDPNGLLYLASAKRKIKALQLSFPSSYLTQALTQIERAEKDIENNKKSSAGQRVETIISLLSSFRTKFSQAEVWTKSVSTGEDLVNAYQSLMENSGQSISQRTVNSELRICQRLIDLAKRRLASTGTKIKALSFGEGENKKTEGETAYSATKYFRAHILALFSQSLLMEAF